MKKALKAILLLLTVFLVVINGQAQVYPVSGNGVLIPPYSVYLADYTAGTSDRLVLNLVLNDVTRPELRVRLRTKIIGQNITLETKPEYIGKEFVLQGGIPLRITGSELTEYFSPANLNFSGITKREFEKTGALPAGFYQFCFEVLEYNRGVKISNSICANGWLILNDPPLINLPRNGEKLVPTQPQNVVFQWTPRHTGSPNSAFSTEYDIKLVELWPANRNPNDAILTSPPILEETTRSTTFIYDVSQTPLEAGRHYALQVKAKSIVGAEELDLFKNNGKSEVITFIYGDPCTVPQSIFAESNSATRFTVKWTGALNHTAYSLKYRLADSPTAEWYTNTTLLPDAGISGLLPGTTYEYQVAGSCGNFESEYSGIARIKTLSAGEQGYTCGMPLEQFNLDPANLIDVLKVGDVIQAGDFDVKVAKVSGSSGTFSGEGVIEVPFFNKAKIKAEFSSIVVNKDMRMVSGYMNVTGAGVEVVPSGVINLIDQLSETLSALDTALTNIENNLPQPFDEFAFVADTVLTLPGPVIVSQETDGTVVITDANGNEHRLPKSTEAAVVDDQGNGTLIDANGKAHNVSAAVATAAGNREYNLMLRFAESQNHHYGFDAITSGTPDGLKKLYDKLEDNYYVPFKAIETGKTDLVSAILEGTAIDKSKLRFERGGVPVTASPFSGNNTTVTVSANMGGEQEALIAVLPGEDERAKDQVLGRVNVVTYNQIQKVVHIVPVNGNNYKFGSAGSLQNELNKIYSQAVVSWSVQIESGIQVEEINPFNVGETGLLTNYTDHMKKVISAYKAAAGMQNDENSFYLFLVNAPSDPKIAGYMPRSKQSGFIFSDQHNSETTIARTMAHELGHGAFNLHHTFMEENFSLPKNSTDNLMDYNGGTKLYKYQWDMIRYPAVVMGVFEGDNEGQSMEDFEEFYVRVSPLMRDNEFEELMKKFRRIVDFFKECDKDNWASYDEFGIVPYCFWKDQGETVNYTIADLPFTAGIIDGGYSELKGLYEISNSLGSMRENIRDLIYAYTLAYWDCRELKMNANRARYVYVIERLAEEDEKDGIWQWVQSYYNGYEDEKNDLEEYFTECFKAEDTREYIEEIYELVNSWEEIKSLYDAAKSKILSYFSTLSKSDNLGRYERGRLLIPAATTLIPLLGEVTKISRVKAFLKAVKEISDDGWRKLTDNIGKAAQAFTRVYKKVEFKNFAETVPEFKNGANRNLAEEAYRLWGEERWTELNKLFNDNNLNGKWPPFNGAKSVSKVEKGKQLVDKVFDRFQGPGEISGRYGSPVYKGEGIEDLYFTYDSRALKYTIEEGTTYFKFRITKDISDDVTFKYGEVIPWWGKAGLGDQIESSKNLFDLLSSGELEIVEKMIFRNGKWVSQ